MRAAQARRMDDATVYSDDPARRRVSSRHWASAWLHVVDLDGAFAGRPSIARRSNILSRHPGPGPARRRHPRPATVEAWLERGVRRVILGRPR